MKVKSGDTNYVSVELVNAADGTFYGCIESCHGMTKIVVRISGSVAWKQIRTEVDNIINALEKQEKKDDQEN